MVSERTPVPNSFLWLLLPLVPWDILQHHSQEGVPTIQRGWRTRMKLMNGEPVIVTADVLVGMETRLKETGGKRGSGIVRGQPSVCVTRGLPSPPFVVTARVVGADYTITGGHEAFCRLSNETPSRSSDHLGLHCTATVSPAPSRCQRQTARPSAQLLNLMSCILIRVLHSTEVPGWPRRIDCHRS